MMEQSRCCGVEVEERIGVIYDEGPRAQKPHVKTFEDGT